MGPWREFLLVSWGPWAGSPGEQRAGSPLDALAGSQCHGGLSRVGLTGAGQGVGVGFLTGSPGRGGVWVVLFQGEGFKEFNDGTEEDHQRDDAIGDEEHLVEAFGEAITVEAYVEKIDVPP